MRYLLLLLLITGCEVEPLTPAEIFKYKVDLKYCVSNCMKYEFKKFHNSSSAFLGGAGSSSMNGLTQTQIYDRVKKECVEFYEGETCCTFNYEYGIDSSVKAIMHGWDFNACKI